MTQTEPLKILIYPDPFLAKRARPVTAEELKAGKADGWDLAELVTRMQASLSEEQGLGLAATQVGVGLRLFLAKANKEDELALVVLNPVLSELRGSVVDEEGCLSVPGLRAKVKRYASLHVNGVDLKGQPFSLNAQDLFARICQHETDHLDGILFFNRLGMASRLLVRRRLAELEQEYEDLRKRKRQKRAVNAIG
ncbi:MAG: peptide deformylase [Planctomycetota bacterium]